MRLVEHLTIKLVYCPNVEFIVKCSTFYAQTHVDPGKIRAFDLNLLVLEAYLELSDGIGTKLKLCFSTFSFCKRF